MTYQTINNLPDLPPRPADGHKGTFGRALIVAGSHGMSGAAVLAGLGALRGGAGLVTLAVPADIQSVVATMEPSYLTVGLPCSHGQFSDGAVPQLLKMTGLVDAVGCGCGWGQTHELQDVLDCLLKTVEVPMVIDADALNLIATYPKLRLSLPGKRILTPHPGEFARLIGADTTPPVSNRVSLACEFADRHQVVLVLKGAGTIVTDGARVAINRTGNSGMGTGGTGDVLTGILTALLAQGMAPFEAAQLGTHLHGLAGDIAAAHQSQPGLIASDLPRYLGAAWLKLMASPSAS